MLIYFALENLIPRDKFHSSENTPQDTVCNAIIIPGTPVLLWGGGGVKVDIVIAISDA